MADMAAVGLEKLIEHTTTDDGLTGLFRFSSDQGEIVLAIPCDQLMPTMAALSDASGRCLKIQKGNPAIKHVLPCDWWSMEPAQSGTGIVLSFRMPAGMEMSFQIHASVVPRMRETLQALEGNASMAPTPGTSKH